MAAKKHSSKWYYDHNAKSKSDKYKYDKTNQKKRSYVIKRVEANQANRDAGTYGNGDGKDYDHERGVMVKASENRERNKKYIGANTSVSSRKSKHKKGYRMNLS